eukprot:SAG25_NODE_1874_length_2224_cov_1.468235_1_plen_58_part_00
MTALGMIVMLMLVLADEHEHDPRLAILGPCRRLWVRRFCRSTTPRGPYFGVSKKKYV